MTKNVSEREKREERRDRREELINNVNKEIKKEYYQARYQQIKNKTWVFVKDRPHTWTREYSNHYHQEYAEKTRLKILGILGNKCVLCGFYENNKQKLHFHEVHGQSHKYDHGLYILKHSEDFVPLCSKCHNFIHIFCRSNGNVENLVNLLTWIKRFEQGEVRNGKQNKA